MNFLGWGRFVVVCFCALVVSAAGCGGGDDSQDASAQAPEGPAIPSSRPEIDVPEGLPPTKLVIKDLRKGTGAEARKGSNVQIHYYGIQWEDGTEHANSWRYSGIPVFKVGSRRLLYGLNLALPGMKEGGSREVIIPHNIVYYPGVKHRPLGRLSALIYKIYLVKVFGKKNQQG